MDDTITGRLRRRGQTFYVTVPFVTIEALGLLEGDYVTLVLKKIRRKGITLKG